MNKKLAFDSYNCCTSTCCKFRSECAQHYSAGDFRVDDGFRPCIIRDSDGELACESCGSTSDDALPLREDTRGVGAWTPRELERLTISDDVQCLDASNMRKIALKSRENKSTYSQIISSIKTASDRGETEISFLFKSNEEQSIVEKLQKLGYIVQILNFPRGDEMTINW